MAFRPRFWGSVFGVFGSGLVPVWVLILGAIPARAEEAIPRPEHPTPQFVRSAWANLNGTWEFRFDPEDRGRREGWHRPGTEGFDKRIVVPFPWESRLSGLGEVDYRGAAWYRRTIRVPDAFPAGDRVFLHFGAVDYEAEVWIDGKSAGRHEGGYTPFAFDVTDLLGPDRSGTLVVRAFDPTDPELPTGKQVGWYTPCSGIWQTVWLESRPPGHLLTPIYRTRFTPNATDSARRGEATIEVPFLPAVAGEHAIEARFRDPEVATAKATVPVRLDRVGRPARATLKVSLPNKPWSPESPHLFDLELRLTPPEGRPDSVRSYLGLREIARAKVGNEPFERILLNGEPIFLRGALDQSFNPEGIQTAPSDEFLRNDVALAKSLGLNMLRIHIKTDEPRKLHWADKLGMLIMQDVPNTWRQTPRAREAWERGARAAIERDRNSPSVFAWVAFNETWGLGTPEEFKANRDTQEWVLEMTRMIRSLDPTRLIEDNSPCNYDHVETDINSWHFYIDDHESARRHIQTVVDRTAPGSGFNYCPGRSQTTAPLINSEYGGIAADGGDRDVSWAFRDLTTQLRKHDKIQGYVYTELTDIEWEHNGFADYDRRPKEFGYEAFVPGMTVADLQGADFVGYDAPPAIEAAPGTTIELPVFASHYSSAAGSATLKWALHWTGANPNDPPVPETREPERHSGSREVKWDRRGVTHLPALRIRIPESIVEPRVGAVALTLEDAEGRRIAANYVNVIVTPPPRIAVPGKVAVAFDPSGFARSVWSDGAGSSRGKAEGRGHGFLEYRLRVPAAVAAAGIKGAALEFEASSRAGRERVDWPERVNALDNPQTDSRKWPTTAAAILNGQTLGRFALEDDPADARGVLSHRNRDDHGSYGEYVRLGRRDATIPLDDRARRQIDETGTIVLRFAVPSDAEARGGLSLFGAGTGRLPFDPTLILETERPVAEGAFDPAASWLTDTAASRRTELARDGRSENPTIWRRSTSEVGPGWVDPDFDDANWESGPGGFGTPGTPAIRVRTRWDTPTIRLRTTVEVPELGPGDRLSLTLFHDEDARVFVNGTPVLRTRGYVTEYREFPLDDSVKRLFRPGRNTIAVECRQTGGGQGIDLGLILTRDLPDADAGNGKDDEGGSTD